MDAPEESTAYIGLGSNLGDRHRTLQEALDALGSCPGIHLERVSSFLETEPVGGPQQGLYINAAAQLRTRLQPDRLLARMQEIERRFGRRRDVRWGPRTLDLDLLLYDARIISRPDLHVPHPRMHQRRFVLAPLVEIAPDIVHPILNRTLRGLLADLDRPPADGRAD